MKKLITTWSILLCSISLAYTQVFWTEDFGTGCNTGTLAQSYSGANGSWSITSTGTNGAYANLWYVSAAENGEPVGNCGVGCGADPSMHVGSSIFGDLGAAYFAGGLPGATTNVRVESPVIDCSGKSTITWSFVYIENGQGSTDNATALYFDGSTWATLSDPAKTTICGSGQGMWTAYSIALPASADNNPNVRIGFNWTNNGSVGTDPSFAVDDIQLSEPLPLGNTSLDLVVFYENNIVQIQGKVASHKRYSKLEIQHAKQSIQLDFISVGTPQIDSDFYFVLNDSQLDEGLNYFRIKATTTDGIVEYSEIKSLFIRSKYNLSVFPNPAINKVIIKSGLITDGMCELQFVDVFGRVLKSKSISKNPTGEETIEIDLPKGVYNIQLSGQQGTHYSKLMVN